MLSDHLALCQLFDKLLFSFINDPQVDLAAGGGGPAFIDLTRLLCLRVSASAVRYNLLL